MTDRLTVITHLKMLADSPALRGVDRAAELLHEAAQMLYEDGVAAAALSQRRTSDSERQERRRKKKAESVTLGHVKSREQRDAPSVFPHTPFPTPPESTTTTPRERETPATPDYDSMVDLLAERVCEATRELWPDVDGFVKRRDYATWKGWLKEMLAVLTGGIATPADLAQVCRDDEALARPIGSPKGLRAFVSSQARERLEKQRSSTPSAKPSEGRGAIVLNKIRSLIKRSQQPGQAERRFIRRADVEKMGADVLEAYDAIGGADRIINSTGEQFGFVIRDFTNALEAAHVAA